MNIREQLAEAERAYTHITTNNSFKVSLQYNFQTDPASGRSEFSSVTIPRAYTDGNFKKRVVEMLKLHINDLRRLRAKELREEADRIDERILNDSC